MTAQKEKPVVIMGGGPAGVFTACGLARLNIPVMIITRPRPFPAWEGLSERPYGSLQYFGFKEAVASIGPMVERTAHWNGTSQVQNREYILNRHAFDMALLQDARHHGVQVSDGRIDKTERLAKGKGWQVSYMTRQGPETVTTDFLVEARGRESKMGRKQMPGEGVFITAPATSALLKSYHVPSSLAAATSVASFPKGWAWYLRDGLGMAILQIFLSSEKGELPPKADLGHHFSQMIALIPEATEWLRDARPHDSIVSVRSAAAAKTLPVGGADFLVVGDGALALDPLSGNGIFYALGGGLAAAPVINTLLNRPKNGDLALKFYQERLDFSFKSGCIMGREFYAAETRWPEENFWKARSHWPLGEETSHPDPLSMPAKICKKPVVKEGYIALEDVIVTADHPRGIWMLDGVPLAALAALLKSGSRKDHDNAVALGTAIEDIAQARAWLMSRHLI